MPRTVPLRPARDIRLDIMRGWLQWSIFASHATGSFIGGWLIHASWGLSDSSEQFVFLSGFTLGSAFARRMLGNGWRAATGEMLQRTWRLYRTHLATFALFGLMIILAGRTVLPMEARRLGWAFMLDDPAAAILAALGTLYQPVFMGILPLFVWCMLALPAFGWLQSRCGGWALAAPVALYAAYRLWRIDLPSLAPDTGIAFQPLAWQLPFMLGAWAGRRALLGGRSLPFQSRWVGVGTAVALAIVIAGFLLRLGWYGFAPWPAPFPETEAWVGKEGLAPPRLLHALALVWLVAALFPREARWMHGMPGRALAAMGRHSLQIFCVGLFLSWGASVAFRLRPDVIWLDPLMMLAGLTILAALARQLELRRVRPIAASGLNAAGQCSFTTGSVPRLSVRPSSPESVRTGP